MMEDSSVCVEYEFTQEDYDSGNVTTVEFDDGSVLEVWGW